MSGLHLNHSKTVGVTLWVGDLSLRKVELYCITSNSKFFDEFYLITDREQPIDKEVYPSLKQIINPNICQEVYEYAQGRLYNNLPTPFKANYVSDILTYFPKEILKKFGNVDADSVMYLDSDYLLYSKFILNELFSYLESGFYLLKDNNYYFRYPNKDYVNSCWSLDFTDLHDADYRWEILDKHLAQTDISLYSCIGPRFTNSELIMRVAKIAPLVPHTFDPRYVHLGSNEEDLVKGALGCHLAVTLPKEVGFIATQVFLSQHNKIEILFTADN